MCLSEGGWALLGALVGMLGTGLTSWLLQRWQHKHEKDMWLLEHQGPEMVKEHLLEMLNHRTYTDRSFKSLRRGIGGYTDDQVRVFLHEVGARKVTKGEEDSWYLVAREGDRK